MMPLVRCTSCSIYIRPNETTCPFCTAAHAPRAHRLVTTTAVLVAMMSIAGCGYGLYTHPDAGTHVDAHADAHVDALVDAQGEDAHHDAEPADAGTADAH